MRIVTRFEVQRHMMTQMAPPEHLLITTCVLLPHFQSDRVSFLRVVQRTTSQLDHVSMWLIFALFVEIQYSKGIPQVPLRKMGAPEPCEK